MKEILFALLLLFQNVQAQEVTIVSKQGETIALNVNSHLPLQHILNEAATYLASVGEHYNVYITNVEMKSESLAATVGRDYNKPVNDAQFKDISYIVKTLGSAPYKTLLKNKSSLKKAGDRIDVLHPLRFLQTLFTNEELKASAHALRQRTFFVWGEFFDPLKDTLDEEYMKGNISDAQILDFSKNIGIDPNTIMGVIHNRDWQGFYDTLLAQLPRQGNPGRFDM